MDSKSLGRFALIFTTIFSLGSGSLGGVAQAQEPQLPAALTFQAWKDQQVLESQNQILRISARINQIKTGKTTAAGTADTSSLPSNRIKKTAEGDALTVAEKDLKRGQEAVETAAALQLSDYVLIYLPTLQDQPEATSKLIEQLSKEELIELTKALIRKSGRPLDAKRSSGNGRLETLVSSARNKSL